MAKKLIKDIDFDPAQEGPYTVFQGLCFVCRENCCITERLYTSEITLRGHGKWDFMTYNFGKTVTATECCCGLLCPNCARKEDVYCSFCKRGTSAMFIAKESSRMFSSFAGCLTICNWFEKLENFERVKESMGEKSREFFLWLKPRRSSIPDFYWWHNLCLESRSTQELIAEFKTSQLACEQKQADA
jgi:hypothetical protein